jgi:hypothetical protein
MLSVEALRRPATRNQVYAWCIELLKSLGFQTSGWQPGRIQRTTFTTISAAVADLTELGKATVEFNYNELAKGPPLTEFSRSRFDNDRNRAIKTRGPMRLRSVATIPYAIKPLQLIVADSAGTEFRNVAPGTLPAGSPVSPSQLVLEFEARVAGSRGNVGFGTVTRMVTPLAGVTVSNDMGDPWYTVTGVDEESDESLQRRNATKWATLSLIMVREGFENVGRSAGALKIDVDDSNPRGAGTVDVYAAGDLALLGAAQMEAIQLAFSRRVLNTSAIWPPEAQSLVHVKEPQTHPLVFSGTVYFDAAVEQALVRDGVRTALRDLVIRTPIGGHNFSPGPENVVSLGDILEAVEEVDGVRTVTTSLTTNVPVGSRTLVVPPADPDWGLAFEAVTA